MQKIVDFILKLLMIIWITLVFAFFLSQMQFDEITINGTIHRFTQFETHLFSILFSSVFVIASFLMPPFNIIMIYLIYRKVTKNRIRKNIKFEKHNLGYCRENLNKLSPGIISYLKNFNVEFEKDVGAHILKLLYEGYLIEDGNVIKISNKDKSSLSQADLLVLNMVNDNDFSFSIKSAYEKAIEKESMDQGLIALKSKRWKNVIIKFILFNVCSMFLATSLMTFAGSNISDKISVFVSLIAVLIFISMSCAEIYFIANILSLLKTKSSIIRTSKGKQITKNAFGLEKFLRDFSAFEQSNYKEVYTREYFLIYAVVLNINKTIPKEIMQRCNNL